MPEVTGVREAGRNLNTGLILTELPKLYFKENLCNNLTSF